jgi:hypothetical protein
MCGSTIDPIGALGRAVIEDGIAVILRISTGVSVV